jgi:hypothetical protein
MMEDIIELLDMIIAYHMNIGANRTGVASDIAHDVFKLYDSERVQKMATYLHEVYRGVDYKILTKGKGKK